SMSSEPCARAAHVSGRRDGDHRKPPPGGEMTRSLRKLTLIHVFANALLLWLAYYWLGLAESRASALAWSLFVAVLILSLVCWVYGAAFACMEENPWRTALRN